MTRTIPWFIKVILAAALFWGCCGGSSEQEPVTLDVSVKEDGGVRLDVSDNSGLKTVRTGRLENSMYGLMLLGEAKHRDRRINLIIDCQNKSVVAFVSFTSPLRVTITFPKKDIGGNDNITIIHDGLAENQNMVYARRLE